MEPITNNYTKSTKIVVPSTKYIITEENICTIRDYILEAFYEGESKEKTYDHIKSEFSVIRSHPYNPQTEQIICCAICPCSTPDCEEGCPNFEESSLERLLVSTRRDEREKVLDVVEEIFKHEWNNANNLDREYRDQSHTTILHIKNQLKELRQDREP